MTDRSTTCLHAEVLAKDRGYSDRFGDSLGVAGAGSLFPKESLVSTLSPFSCSRYIATTSVPSWSAPGRSVAPGGVSSVVPSLRVSWVPDWSTLVLRQNLHPLSGRPRMLSRQAEERVGDCRQEGRPAVRVGRAATEGRRTFLEVGRRAA